MEHKEYEYWNEYPKRDPQAVVWYPCQYSKINSDEIWENKAQKEIGFYLHIPFCKGICKYCPFNKYEWSSQKVEEFIACVKQEIELVTANDYFKKSKVIAGYFGGGTPTCLTTKQIEELLLYLKAHLKCSETMELTIEATPDTVDEEKLIQLKRMGFNRISFGVQSFQQRFLKIIGRSHYAQNSFVAVELAKKVGFDVVSIDLLYRIPGQTLKDWKQELETALRLDVDHITTFSLFLDPGTKLYEEKLEKIELLQPNEQTEIEMYQMAVECLEREGYHLYSLYDFAKEGKECLHHAINWKAPQGDYVSFGPGAFSYIDIGKYSHIYCNCNTFDEYKNKISLQQQPVEFGKKLTKEEEMSRFMVLGFNFLHVNKQAFQEKFAITIREAFGSKIKQLEEWELIVESEEAFTLTAKGRIYLANVSKYFYTSENKNIPHLIGVELQKQQGLSLEGINYAQADKNGGYHIKTQ